MWGAVEQCRHFPTYVLTHGEEGNGFLALSHEDFRRLVRDTSLLKHLVDVAEGNNQVQQCTYIHTYIHSGVCVADNTIHSGVCVAGMTIHSGVCVAGMTIHSGVCVADKTILRHCGGGSGVIFY